MRRRLSSWAAAVALSGAAALAGIAALAPPAAAQQVRVIEIRNADRVVVETDSLTGVVRRLTGDVRLREDTTRLRADRATLYEARREAVLSGRVRIVSGDDTLTADRVTYDANVREALATGSVRIGSERAVLLAPRVTYSVTNKRATFAGGGRLLADGAVLTAPSGTYDTERRVARLDESLTLVDSTGTLTAARGTYDARTRRADAVGRVRLVRPGETLDADSLVYFRRTERARAFGRVVLDRLGEGGADRAADAPLDSTRRSVLFAGRMIVDGQAETARADDDPLLVVLRRDSLGVTDTTVVRAARLHAARRDSAGVRTETLTAVGAARVVQASLTAVADSARFVRTAAADPRDRLDLDGAALGLSRPAVWADGAQLSGDTLRVTQDAAGDRVLALGRAFVGRVDSTLGRLQQLGGARLLGLLRGERLRALRVWPTAEALIYQAAEDGRLSGAEQIGADSLDLRFDAEGEIRDLGAFGSIEGTVYGPSIVPTGTRLGGFAFDPAVRPTRDAVLPPDAWPARWLARHPRFGAPAPGDDPEPAGAPAAGAPAAGAPAEPVPGGPLSREADGSGP